MLSLDTLTPEQLAACMDHTLLRAQAVRADFELLCQQARNGGFCSVAVNPAQVALCRRLLEGSGVKVCAVVGFPLGQNGSEGKLQEALRVIADGAQEVDYVLDIGALRDGRLDAVEREMALLTDACHSRGAACKVIFETCYLTPGQITAAAEIARRIEPDFIKTSTGFGTGGATVADVRRMAEAAGPKVRVKASGGIRTWEDCRAMLQAGAERIGTSAAPQILAEFRASRV